MTTPVFENFSSGQLAGPATDTDTVFTLYAGQGLLFPTPVVGSEHIVAVVEDALGIKEVVHITEIIGDTLTVLRAQEDTTAVAFAINARVESRVTEGFLKTFIDGGEF